MRIGIILIAVILLLVAGCSSDPIDASVYDIVGRIETINHSQSGNITSCLVVASDPSSVYRHAHVRIIGDTKIRHEGSAVSIEPDQLSKNMLVGITFKGAIAESDPIQVNAGQIVILD